MKITLKNIREQKTEDIYIFLSSCFDKLILEFSYLNLSEIKIKEIINNEIEKSKQTYDGSLKYEEFITKKVQKRFEYLAKDSLNDETKSFITLNSYVDKLLSNRLKEEYLEFFNQFEFFLKKYGYTPNPDEMLYLIQNNQNYANIISYVVSQNIEKIKENKIYDLFSELLSISIETYCMLNNIKILDFDDYEELQNVDLSSDDSYTTDSLRMYLNEIGNKSVLSNEEEIILANRLAKGDKEAQKILIEHNLKLVVSISKRFVNSGMPILDLIQEGNVGLIKATEKFDISREIRFSTYATFWIRQAMVRAITDKGRNIRIPAHKHGKIYNYKKIVNKYKVEYKREPTVEEIACEMNLTVEEVKELEHLQYDTVSLNAMVGDDAELEEFVLVSDENIEEEVLDNIEEKEIINFLKSCRLQERELKIILYRFGFFNGRPMTLEEVGKIFNVTRERIRQIEAKALKKIRNNRHIQDLAVFTQNPEESIKNIKYFRQKYRETGLSHKTFLREGKTEKIEQNSKENEERTERKRKMPKKLITIYQLLKEYTKDEVNEMLESLNEEEKALITLRYGDDLDNPKTSEEWNQESHNMFYGRLLSKMRRQLTKITKKNNPEEDDLKLINDDALFNNIKSSQDVSSNDKAIEEQKNDSIKVFDLFQSPIFKEMMKVMPAKESVIISLKFGHINDKCFSTESIAQFLGIEESEVREIIKKNLVLYKESLNKIIDLTMDKIDAQKLVRKD